MESTSKRALPSARSAIVVTGRVRSKVAKKLKNASISLLCWESDMAVVNSGTLRTLRRKHSRCAPWRSYYYISYHCTWSTVHITTRTCSFLPPTPSATDCPALSTVLPLLYDVLLFSRLLAHRAAPTVDVMLNRRPTTGTRFSASAAAPKLRNALA